ncbi:MAG: protein phosphatase CheZ [Pseudomonadota bacterium]|nr:protein phosphatase CheZ [Pseudomonadota bacterium]
MSDKTKENIKNKLDALEASDAEMVPMSQVRELTEAVRGLFKGEVDELDTEIFGELAELARFINEAKKEQSFQPEELAEKGIPDASDQLDAIVATTEKATTEIMDACEAMQADLKKLKDSGADEASVANMEAQITAIFEACNFQDLTGQRIQKIVKTLKQVEQHILRMVVVFGMQKKADNLSAEQKEFLQEEAELLNGPQLPGNSLEQDDIDDILDTLL